jgi:hypothetical protein
VELLELFQHANWRRALLGTHEFTRDEVLIHPLDALVQASIELAQVWLHSWMRSKRDVLDDSSRYFDRCLAITAGLPPVQSAFPAVPKEVERVSYASWTLLWQWKEHLRLTAQLRLLEAAAGLQAFHVAHGQWPPTLNELVPSYLDQVPADPFSPNQGLRYQRVEGRIMLYSVGPDGTDDGGSLDASEFNNWRGDIILPNLNLKAEPTRQDN